MTHRNLYRTLATAALALPLLSLLPACGSLSGQQTQKQEQHNRWNQTRIGVLYQLAQQQYQVGDYDKARATLRQAFALNYPHAATHVLAAKVEIEKGGLQVAADHLKTAIQIDANYVEAYYLQGVVYQRWQNNQAAHDYYKIAWEKKPNEALFLLALVEMKIALNQQDDARKLLEEKLVYFEQTAAVRAALARLYALAGDHAQAVTFYRAASLLSPEDLTLRQNFAEELYFAGRYSECLPILEDLAKNPAAEDRASVRTVLGKTYIALRRPRDARSIFAEITRDDPNDNLAWLELGRATLQLEDYQQAASVAQRVLKIEPRNLDALILLSLCQHKQKQWDSARTTLAKAHDVAPTNPTVLCLMGVTAQNLGQKEQAVDFYAEALKLKPSDPWAEELLATAKPGAAVPAPRGQ